MQQNKRCSICVEVKPASDFHIVRAKDGRQWLQGRCKSCSVIYLATWKRARTPQQLEKKIEGDRWRIREKKYGITKARYDALLAEQGGVCAICKRPERAVGHDPKRVRGLSVDHDHETNELRGLLCHSCNVAIGLFDEDTEVLESAVKYLSRSAKRAAA